MKHLREITIPHLFQKVFYDINNGILFSIIQKMYDEDIAIDYITLGTKITDEAVKDKLYELITISASADPNVHLEYVNVIYEKYFRRSIIEEFSSTIDDAYNNSVSIDEITNKINKSLDKYIFSNADVISNTAANAASSAVIQIEEESKGKKTYYLSGNDNLDTTLYFGPKNIMLLGGKGGSGKTRWLIYFILNLLERNKDVSVLWYNMEDPSEKIMRCMIGYYLKMDDNTIRSRKGKLSYSHIDSIKIIKDKISAYDIKFCEQSETIDNIYREFMKFVVSRKNKFCILIIDNLMLLDDHTAKNAGVAVEDYISRRISALNKAANKVSNIGATIIPVHHFSKDQADKLNVKEAYRPRNEHLKGSTRIVDVSTQIVLINRIEMYKDLITEFKHINDIISRLFITEITKNRDGETAVIRWFTDIGTSTFYEINKTTML